MTQDKPDDWIIEFPDPPTKPPMRLTARQQAVLASMAWWDTQWVRPLDVGGRNGSHHSATLAQLVGKGLAESRWRTGPGGKWARGSKIYRLTERGLAAAKWCEWDSYEKLSDRLAQLAAKA